MHFFLIHLILVFRVAEGNKATYFTVAYFVTLNLVNTDEMNGSDTNTS